jgi:pimeloyl-ACP methyl ester carboxylesterase
MNPTHLLHGIQAHDVVTSRLTANVLERPAAASTGASAAGASVADATTVVFVHGNVSSSIFWQPVMLDLPSAVRALAIDLRGFGDSETLPVDATRGLRDYADDVEGVLDTLGTGAVHLVGWSMGGGIVLQLLLDHPERVASVTLVAPVSPYGFGGTAGPDGRVLTDDSAGTGAGGANPDFVARLAAGDRADEPTSPRTVYRTTYVTPGFESELEDLWVESMLTTKTGVGNYPGDSVASENWPGFAAGPSGVLNTMAPRYFDASGIVDLLEKPPVLWIHGENDVIVSDASYFDINYLGQVGVIPGWPGEDVAPAQPMVTQTRAVLDRYAAAGGAVTELSWAHCGHSPHLQRPAEFVAALAEHIAR